MANERDKSKISMTADLSRGIVSIEGEGDSLIRLIGELKELAPHLEIRIIPASGDKSSPPTQDSKVSSQEGQHVGSLRQFAKSFPLSNFYERIAVIGFYLIKVEGKAFFTTREVDDAFLLCGFEKPSQINTAFSDCKRKYGYIKNLERGKWMITPGAENLIMQRQGKGGEKG